MGNRNFVDCWYYIHHIIINIHVDDDVTEK